jgi:exopolyphosphatase / guanosine-5'-triphosphate,3'-diphosphate pyrophosphatase
MNDDTRLRDGLGSRESPIAPVAAGDDGEARLVPGSGVYAALDLGTNNCRLLIACPTNDGFRVVDSFSRIIRLGEGISTTGYISEAAIERAVAASAATRSSPKTQHGCG